MKSYVERNAFVSGRELFLLSIIYSTGPGTNGTASNKLWNDRLRPAAEIRSDYFQPILLTKLVFSNSQNTDQ